MRKNLIICMVGTRLSSNNVGDNAILLGIQDSVQEIRNVTFKVITSNPERVRTIYKLDAFAPKKEPLEIIKALIKSDALFFTGGTPFWENNFQMGYKTFIACLMSFFRKPTIVYAISLREITSPCSKFFLKLIADKSAFIGAREHETLKEFISIVKDRKKVSLFPDPATQLIPIGKDESQKLLKEEGTELNRKMIGICLRNFKVEEKLQKHFYSTKFNDETLRRFLTTLKETIEFLVKEKDCSIICFPMNVDKPDDDRQAALALLDAIKDQEVKGRIKVIMRQYNPREIKGMLGEMFLVIGVRFHSLVLSSSMYTPLISIGYAQKNKAFMEYIGQSEFSTAIQEVSIGYLKEKLNEIFLKREKIVNKLKYRYKEIDDDYKGKLEIIIRKIEENNNGNSF